MANEVAMTNNVLNYSGTLYSKTDTQTPFFTMIAGKEEKTDSIEFEMGSGYSLEEASQPSISEKQSLVAPDAKPVVREQDTNVIQIFQKKVDVSYLKQSSSGSMSGVNRANQQNNAPNELDFQMARKMEEMRRDIEYTFLNGVYQKASSEASAYKTRGIIEGIKTNTKAVTGKLTKAMVDDILLTAFNNNARLNDGEFAIFVNPSLLTNISSVYAATEGYNQPADRMTAGFAIRQIYTDFGIFDIIPDKFVPTNTLLGADLGVCKPKAMDTPDKGNFFSEQLSKQGACESWQIYGQEGLDYGAEWFHFKITGIGSTK